MKVSVQSPVRAMSWGLFLAVSLLAAAYLLPGDPPSFWVSAFVYGPGDWLYSCASREGLVVGGEARHHLLVSVLSFVSWWSALTAILCLLLAPKGWK